MIRKYKNYDTWWFGKIKILTRNYHRKRLTSEMILIKFNKFSINKKEDIFTLNRIYFSLLNRLNSW